MTEYLSYTFEDNQEFISTFDELPLWSASFGLLLLKHLELQKAISNKYIELVSKLNLQNIYSTNNVFVCYSLFSSIYTSEIYNSVPKDELENLFKKYQSDLVWQIQNYGSGLIIFFYSNVEKDNPGNDSMVESLTNGYFSLLKPFDEFDYLKRVWIKRESKEDFENIYESNWFWWSRDH